MVAKKVLVEYNYFLRIQSIIRYDRNYNNYQIINLKINYQNYCFRNVQRSEALIFVTLNQ